MSNFVESLKKGQSLSFEESKALFNELMEGKYNENSIIEILESLVKKGETKDELAGGIFVLREKATKVKAEQDTIDTCGTGGDGQNSLNISTAAAIVLASMGVKVAKHGNKAVSSNCGSADVLEALNININLKSNEAEESIKKFNFAFMFAPNYHSAMKHVGPARKKMGKKTIFNLIGPLSSPAQVKRQVIGVFDKKWMKPFAEALKENGVIHAFIVHSEDGMDEISPFAKTYVVELKDTFIKEFVIFSKVKKNFIDNDYQLIFIPSMRTPKNIINKAKEFFDYNQIIIQDIDKKAYLSSLELADHIVGLRIALRSAEIVQDDLRPSLTQYRLNMYKQTDEEVKCGIRYHSKMYKAVVFKKLCHFLKLLKTGMMHYGNYI